MRTLTLAAAVAAVASAGAVAAQPTPDHFKPFEFLIGHCWTGTFPDGKATNTHCYEWMLDRAFIRDRHVVKSSGPDYKGETVYYLDGATGSVKYRYWNTIGGLSDGALGTDAKRIQIVEDVYRGKDGKTQKFQGEIERLSDTQYRASTRTWDGKAWKALWSITFTRIDAAAPTAAPGGKEALDKAVQQLRETRGRWNVTTEFLKPDGSIAKTVTGTYDFDWVVEDRVLKGVSEISELGSKSAILFHVNEGKGLIEMASVGKDGHLWVMTGPAGGETRTTPDMPMSDGSTMKLRFTRYNVAADRFESKMEVSTDAGLTWVPGNHQTFVRKR
jgi:hypothetical protein